MYKNPQSHRNKYSHFIISTVFLNGVTQSCVLSLSVITNFHWSSLSVLAAVSYLFSPCIFPFILLFLFPCFGCCPRVTSRPMLWLRRFYGASTSAWITAPTCSKCTIHTHTHTHTRTHTCTHSRSSVVVC